MLVTKVVRILINNCKSYIPLLIIIVIIIAVTVISNKEEGNFYIKGIVNMYIITIIEL